MGKGLRGFALLMAANIEAVSLIFGAWYVGQWLNKSYPGPFNWMIVCFGAVIIVIARSWYMMFKTILRIYRGDKE